MSAADGALPPARPAGSEAIEPMAAVEADDDRPARRAALRDLAAMIGVEVFY